MVFPTTNRLLFAIGTERHWYDHQADASLAYLRGRLHEQVYMLPPRVFRRSDRVCLVVGSLYGLELAAKIWYNHLSSFLEDIGFIRSPYDPAL